MVTAVKPRTMARMLIRISRAIDRVEGDRSIEKECLMLSVEKAMACLTATSERSMKVFAVGGLHQKSWTPRLLRQDLG